jgi:hypothetical protein
MGAGRYQDHQSHNVTAQEVGVRGCRHETIETVFHVQEGEIDQSRQGEAFIQLPHIN